jgi:hypothetical protein
MNDTTKITKATAEKVLAALLDQLGYDKNDADDWHSAYGEGPKLIEKWDWLGHGEDLFPHGGIEEEFGFRRRDVSDLLPDGIWVEAMTGWAIGIYR